MEEEILITEPTTTRPMTYGEKAVGLYFNPEGNEKVNKVKKLYAEIIDLCENVRKDLWKNKEIDKQREKERLMLIAITEAQSAQMWAVKGLMWKD